MPSAYTSDCDCVSGCDLEARFARRGTLRAAVGCLFLAVWIGSGCTAQQDPNVIVIVVDALRADRLGCYGHDRDVSPNIDALASEGILFTRTYAQSPWTKPSVPTLFTSLYPMQHRVYEGEAHGQAGRLESDVLSEEHITIAETFRGAGYQTVAFVHNAHLEAAHGFAQGFDRYEQSQLDAAAINQRFIEFLEREPDRPFFAYLHYLDAHWPFQPDPRFRARFADPMTRSIFDRDSWKGLRDRINDGTIRLSQQDRSRLDDLHDAGIAQIDQALGELLTVLREGGVLDDTVVLLTSDHGEELMDHGRVGHGGTLYREVIEIPLIIRLPGGARKGEVAEAARLIDVFPTLAGLAGIEVPPGLEGRNLFAEVSTDPLIVAETRHKSTYRVSLQEGNWKYIRTYKARRTETHAPSPSSRARGSKEPRLSEGMRIKVTGLFVEDGTIHAVKVRRKDPGDDDVEISGAVEFVSSGDDEFRVHGVRVEADDLMDAGGRPITRALQVGEWVKVEGRPNPDGSLRADDFERLAAGDREDELEAIVGHVEPLADHAVRVFAAGFRIEVSKDTRFKGLARADLPPSETTSPASLADPFAAHHLRSPQAPSFEEQLFDLAQDPAEQVDRIAERGARAESLRAGLDAWLDRMAEAAPGRAERRVLDAATIEDLRVLGYVE